MSLLAGLATDDSIENETDSVGGGGLLDSDVYTMKVTMAYLNKSAGGALGLNLYLETDDKREVRETLWVTSGNAKGNKNTYINRRGETKYLPGFNTANSLSLLTTGKEINKLATEEKTVKVYSPDAGGEVPTKVDVITDLIGQEIKAGIQKQVVDKRVKGNDGQYRPSGETREINAIDKFFRAKDNLTTAEIRGGAEKGEFIDRWLDKNQGAVRDLTDSSASASVGGNVKSGAPAAPQKESLFG